LKEGSVEEAFFLLQGRKSLSDTTQLSSDAGTTFTGTAHGFTQSNRTTPVVISTNLGLDETTSTLDLFALSDSVFAPGPLLGNETVDLHSS
jgi:hypothetical protein